MRRAPRGPWPRSAALIWLGPAVLLLHGCLGLPSGPTPLPVQHTLVREPLVVHSDFPLPTHHRLLDELLAERASLLQALALPPSDEPIHIHLFDNEARYQRFLREKFPDFPPRRAFFVETDTRLTVYAFWGDRVAEDLRHEVAHGYLHAAVPRLTLWLDEGLAEYAEVPRGERGLNRPHLELLLAHLQQGWRPNLDRLEALGSAGNMTQLDYAESWAWVHFLLETDSWRRELLQSYLRAVRRDGAAAPLTATLGRMLPRADALLIAHLQSLAARR